MRNEPLKKVDIYEAVKHAFPDVLTEEKQHKKLSNLLQKMKKEGKVDVYVKLLTFAEVLWQFV